MRNSLINTFFLRNTEDYCPNLSDNVNAHELNKLSSLQLMESALNIPYYLLILYCTFYFFSVIIYKNCPYLNIVICYCLLVTIRQNYCGG